MPPGAGLTIMLAQQGDLVALVKAGASDRTVPSPPPKALGPHRPMVSDLQAVRAAHRAGTKAEGLRELKKVSASSVLLVR